MSEGADYIRPNPRYMCEECSKVWVGQEDVDMCKEVHIRSKGDMALLLHQKFCSTSVCKLNWCGVKTCTGKEDIWLERAKKIIGFARKFNIPTNEITTLLTDF